MRLRRGTALGLALLVGACAPVGPDFVRPVPPAPLDWSQALQQGLETGEAELTDWWRVFGDPVLNRLVEDSLESNNSLQLAALAILEARAAVGIATGSQYPQTQVAVGSATLVSPPENTGVSRSYWESALGASASWEIDFWGRYRRAIESADAAYLASLAAYAQAQVVLTAAVVDVYLAIRATEEQLDIAHENARIQQRSLDIAEVLYRNGQSSELDVQQARTLLLATESTIPELESSLRQARNALSVLLGQLPGALEQRLAQGQGIPALPQTVQVGFPADMLRRRPDLLQAEMVAMALNAQVGLAQADLYPSFSLTGSIGLAAGSPGDDDFGALFEHDALTWSVGPSFVWPFFNYGRIRNNVRIQDARLQQALVLYRDTALQAAREAEDAMAAYNGAVTQADILSGAVVSARRSNELATLRYSEGYSDYQRVLDAQQALFVQQQRHVAARSAGTRALVGLYKALGGGWRDMDGNPYLDPQTVATMEQRTDWGELIDNHPYATENGE